MGNGRLKETVYDLNEFLKLKDEGARIHYELYTSVKNEIGFPEQFEAGIILYSISKEGYILQCKMFRKGWWQEVIDFEGGNIHEKASTWISEVLKDFENKAVITGATPGRFEYEKDEG